MGLSSLLLDVAFFDKFFDEEIEEMEILDFRARVFEKRDEEEEDDDEVPVSMIFIVPRQLCLRINSSRGF